MFVAVGGVIQHVCDFSHRIGDAIINGKATSNNTSDIEKGEGKSYISFLFENIKIRMNKLKISASFTELSNTCRESGVESLKLLGCIKEGKFKRTIFLKNLQNYADSVFKVKLHICHRSYC